MYVSKLIYSGSTFLHKLLEVIASEARSLIALITDDVQWFYKAADIVSCLPKIRKGIAQFISWIDGSPRHWQGLVKRHRKAYTAWFGLNEHATQWERVTNSELDGLGISRTSEPDTVPVQSLPALYRCHCGSRCDKVQHALYSCHPGARLARTKERAMPRMSPGVPHDF